MLSRLSKKDLVLLYRSNCIPPNTIYELYAMIEIIVIAKVPCDAVILSSREIAAILDPNF